MWFNLLESIVRKSSLVSDNNNKIKISKKKNKIVKIDAKTNLPSEHLLLAWIERSKTCDLSISSVKILSQNLNVQNGQFNI